ncbi:hypothetical protein E1B28_004520 [Marasmius oreades]|uniref:HSF-type DNA-binding domain-containing protein n=1 Tax=Marasmius oreades TaxID=181124 RepID=A0A9P7UYT5_9AGAR|nr:uncharacterized protein E1B28_004520 [Marasmius oreades]KAG7097142.1 hypothetical protein E1B28_004520 [Marasmius oreades]
MADLYPSATNSPYPSLDTVQNHPKTESKPQATFLTKLYALLERPENHHMIRWDPQGEHIIVERPEQLALHVLPSIYRQSRFASFSRQLNIYGFMRKVNLRNVDPAIDDPDASTWSHPTLNRHSPPEVVANFKRRVPPRLPKPRKRDSHESQLIPPPRSAIPSGGPSSPTKLNGIPPPHLPIVGRARGFSAPGSFTPAWATQATHSNNFSRSSIPPLTVPGASDPPSHSYDDPISPTSSYSSHYSHQNHYQSNPYPDVSSNQWFGSPASSSSSNSLSSLLNPSTRPTPTINTSVNGSGGTNGGYASPFSSIPLHSHHHHHHHHQQQQHHGGSDHNSSAASPLSPDAHGRAHTSYSMSQMGYGGEEPAYAPGPPTSAGGSRPNSSHRQLSPSPRPPSSNRGSPYHTSSSLAHSHSVNSPFRNNLGRARRHSQAISPYPLPYDSHSGGGLDHHTRPSTSPQPHHPHAHHHVHSTHGTTNGSLPRVRSMIQLPSVEPGSTSHAHYGSYANPHHPSNGAADFAYSPVSVGGSTISSIPSSSSTSSLASVSSSAYSPLDYRHSGRPGTSTSSISQNSSSQANTPPLDPFPASTPGAGKFSVSGESGHGTGYSDEGMGVVNVRGYVATDDTFGFTVPGEYGGA